MVEAVASWIVQTTYKSVWPHKEHRPSSLTEFTGELEALAALRAPMASHVKGRLLKHRADDGTITTLSRRTPAGRTIQIAKAEAR